MVMFTRKKKEKKKERGYFYPNKDKIDEGLNLRNFVLKRTFNWVFVG